MRRLVNAAVRRLDVPVSANSLTSIDADRVDSQLAQGLEGDEPRRAGPDDKHFEGVCGVHAGHCSGFHRAGGMDDCGGLSSLTGMPINSEFPLTGSDPIVIIGIFHASVGILPTPSAFRGV